MASSTQWTWVWVNSGSCDGQEGLACCNPWGCKESDMTEWLNWLTDNNLENPYHLTPCNLSDLTYYSFSCFFIYSYVSFSDIPQELGIVLPQSLSSCYFQCLISLMLAIWMAHYFTFKSSFKTQNLFGENFSNFPILIWIPTIPFIFLCFIFLYNDDKFPYIIEICLLLIPCPLEIEYKSHEGRIFVVFVQCLPSYLEQWLA